MMKLRTFFAASLAVVAMSTSAQTHQEGAEYYKADQLANAKELLLRNMNNAGTDKAIANYYLGQIALDEKKLEEAQKYFDAGVQANPEYGYNYIGLGSLALRRGDKKAAETQFKKAEGLLKKDAAAEIAIARAYYDADPTAYAQDIEKKVTKARKINMEHPEIYIFDGDRKKDVKNIGDAAKHYEMAKNYDPNSTTAYVKYAGLFSQVNQNFAVQMLKELLALNPTSALGQRELANAYYNNKDYANAAKEYGVYVQNPNHFKQDEDRYALLLFSNREYKNGYDYASKLLAENPGHFTARRFQFMNAAQLKEMEDKLLPMAEELLAAHNANPEANQFAAIDYTLISEELRKVKRNDEARAVLEEAISNPLITDKTSFLKSLAFTYDKSTDIADTFEQYISMNSNPSPTDYKQQALLCFNAGKEIKAEDAEKAEDYFKKSEDNANKAFELKSDDFVPKKILGDIAMVRATPEEVNSAAFPMYYEAADILDSTEISAKDKKNAMIVYNYLGNYYLDHKENTKAKECFKKVLKFDPENQSIIKLVENIKD